MDFNFQARFVFPKLSYLQSILNMHPSHKLKWVLMEIFTALSLFSEVTFHSLNRIAVVQVDF